MTTLHPGSALAPVLFVGSAFVSSGCSTEQVKGAIYNVGHGNVCLQRDKEGEGSLGMEPCDDSYETYKTARNEALDIDEQRVAEEPAVIANPSVAAPDAPPDPAPRARSVEDALDRCWEGRFTRYRQLRNDITLCITGAGGRMTIKYSNAGTNDPPTACYLDGLVRVLPDETIAVNLGNGVCKNGNEAEPINLKCRLGSDLLKCTDQDRDEEIYFEPRIY